MVENAFGILVARWRIFKTRICAEPVRVKLYTEAAVILHNYLLGKKEGYSPPSFTDRWCARTRRWISGEWRYEAAPLANLDNKELGRKRATQSAEAIRNSFSMFFNNEGVVPWQLATVTNVGPRNEDS